MPAQIKIIHLEMNGEHFYFGSPKAMFDIMGREKMGMSYNSFHSNIHLKVGIPYYNKRNGYTIRVGYLGQAKTNRNSRKNVVAALASAPTSPVQAPENVAPQPVVETSVQPENQTAKRGKKKEKSVPEQLTLF